MATTKLGLKNDHTNLSRISNGWLDFVANQLETDTYYAQLIGPGILQATDFNLTLIGGQIALEVSTGGGVVGDAGNERLILVEEVVFLTATEGLAPSATNYIYVKSEPTYPVDPEDPIDLTTWFTVNQTGVRPANTHLIGTAVANSTEFTSKNDWPSGRVNLEELGVGWYRPAAFEFIVNCPLSEDRLVKVNFGSLGSYARHYSVTLSHDQDASKTIIFDVQSGRTSSEFYFVVQNASDATSGTYGNPTQIKVTVQLEGRLWTPNANPSAPTITTYIFSGGAEQFMYSQYPELTLVNSVAETSLVGTGLGSLAWTRTYVTQGRTFRLKAYGHISTTGTPTLRIKVKTIGGGTNIHLDTGAITLPTVSNGLLYIEAILTCYTTGTPGTVRGQILVMVGGTLLAVPASTATTNLNTESEDKSLDLTAQFGTASPSNSLTITNLVVESLP